MSARDTVKKAWRFARQYGLPVAVLRGPNSGLCYFVPASWATDLRGIVLCRLEPV